MKLIATAVLVAPDGYPGSQEARNVAIANDGAISFERVVRATTLLHPRGQGVIEAPVPGMAPTDAPSIGTNAAWVSSACTSA